MFLKIIIAGEWNGIPYESHKFVIAGSTPVLQLLSLIMEKYIQKEVKIIKQISKQGIEKLLKDGIIRHTHRGYVNPKNGEHIGTSKTVHKIYIEDYYANLVMK